MKKFILIWAVLVLAAPAMAVVTITATPDGDTGNVDLVVTWSGEGTPPRAFALDVNVTSDVNIIDVSGYHTGESETGNKGFGIFPASFNREIDADDPNWADVNYTPVAEPCDLPGDTLGGIGTSGVTLELGSLYTGPNVPTSPTTLATVTVDGSCTMCFSRNVGRGKVVLEDGNEPSSFSAPCVAVIVVQVCTVPDVVNMAEAAAIAAIEAAGFVASSTSGHDCAVTAGYVISQDPIDGGATATCGSTVNIVVADGDTIVPDVVGDTNAVAQAAIIAAGLTVGNITTDCNDSIAAGNVISQNPIDGGATATCGSTVDIVVSTGPCAPPECLKDTDPGYAAWVDFGKPDCWCYKKQCRGDINGTSAFGKPVSGVDNDLFKLAFNKTDAELKAIVTFNGICADLNHTAAFGKRVTGTDNDTFKLYFNVAEASVLECPSTHINFWTN